MARTLNSSRPTRVGPIVHRPADIQLHAGSGEFLDDVARIGQGTGKSVELGSI